MKSKSKPTFVVHEFTAPPPKRRFLRIRQVTDLTGISRSHVYLKAKEGTFPRPIRIGEHSVAWSEVEVLAWMDEREKSRSPLDAA